MSKCREAFVALYKVPESQADFDYEPINPLHSVWKAWQAAWNARPSEELAAEREKVKELENRCFLVEAVVAGDGALLTWLQNDLAAAQATIAQMRGALTLMRKEAENYGQAWARAYVKEYRELIPGAAKEQFDLLAIMQGKLDTVARSISPSNQDALHEALASECERLAGVVTNSRHLLREEAAAHRARKEAK